MNAQVRVSQLAENCRTQDQRLKVSKKVRRWTVTNFAHAPSPADPQPGGDSSVKLDGHPACCFLGLRNGNLRAHVMAAEESKGIRSHAGRERGELAPTTTAQPPARPPPSRILSAATRLEGLTPDLHQRLWERHPRRTRPQRGADDLPSCAPCSSQEARASLY
jgi:hypothetical protein